MRKFPSSETAIFAFSKSVNQPFNFLISEIDTLVLSYNDIDQSFLLIKEFKTHHEIA